MPELTPASWLTVPLGLMVVTRTGSGTPLSRAYSRAQRRTSR